MYLRDYTKNVKTTKKYRNIINTCGIIIIDNYCYYNGKINKNDWHIMALQLRTSYTPENIFNIIKDNEYKGSKYSLDNFLSKFSIICNINYPDIMKIRHKSIQSTFCKCGCGRLSYSGHDYIQGHTLNNIFERDPNYGKRLSATKQGIPYDEWESFARDSPYCPLFNEKCRESNREKYDRRCFLTGLPESENITSIGKHEKLSVHHVDMDKGQGCNGKRWKLVPICMSWHSKVHNKLWESRIIWLLENVWS